MIRYNAIRKRVVSGSSGDYAGMSNDKQVRILFAESLRFPGVGKSAQG